MFGQKTSERLQRQLERLCEAQPDDRRLCDHLEGLSHDEALPGLTWFWGPMLYERNRVVFRSFLLKYFSTWNRESGRWKLVPWSAHAEQLEAWLTAARKNRDTQLVRRLLRWKFAAKRWGLDHQAWNAALLEAYGAARGPAARSVVLDEFDDWFELDEHTALAIYEIDRRSRPFLLKHPPQSFWGGDKRKLWTRLASAARDAGDEDFYWTLYRKQVPTKQWTADVLALAEEISDVDRLNDRLEQSHPEGYGLDLLPTLIKLLERRGRDVMPYVRSRLANVAGNWCSSKVELLVTLAERRGWWDLWAAAIRVAGRDDLFNQAVGQLLDDPSIAESDRLSRLEALAGVSREWNWPGLGLARIHFLKDEIAVRLYRRYPHLIHGPFKPHVTPTWWQGYAQLLEAAQQAEDEELIDLLAGRYATQIHFEHAWGNSSERKRIMATADALGDYYQAIRDRDPVGFARRAANVLTRIPAFGIGGYSYARLLKTNKLARLLLVRSFHAYLAVPSAVRDLVEGSDIYVQMLAYRVLALDDDRARALAVESLDILIGTLLRPLHRKTRLAAFEALANAARSDAQAAALIHRRAREAIRLPDKKYPKEELIGLIGRVLHDHPELRGPKEHPVIYGLEATR